MIHSIPSYINLDKTVLQIHVSKRFIRGFFKNKNVMYTAAEYFYSIA